MAPPAHSPAVVAAAAAAGQQQQQQQSADAAVGGVQTRRHLLAAASAAAAAAAAAAATPLASTAAAAAAAAAAAPAPAPAGGGAGALQQVPHTALSPSSNLSVSRVIKGCWQLSGGHKGDAASNRTEGDAAVADFARFYDAGITTWDAADHYGPAELLIGRYLAQHPEQRPSIQVCSKYCVFSGLDMAGLSKSKVRAAVDLSRRRLGVDKVDLMALYWADYSIGKYVDAALYLTELVSDGVLGAVGVTNFDAPRLEQMLDAGAAIASNQVAYSLLDRRPENRMVALCQARGVAILPYGVLAGGFLSDRYLDAAPRDVRVDTFSKSKYSRVLAEAGGWGALQRLLQVCKTVADKHSTSVSNVAARWVLQRPCVPAVILGARNATHVPDHQALFSFELDAEDEAALAAVLDAAPKARGDCYDWERGGVW